MSDLNVLSPDFKEFVELLIRREVKYENGEKLTAVFKDFGLSSFGLTPDHFSKPKQVIQIGYPTYRINRLTSIDGVNFSEAYSNKNVIEIDGLPIYFISLEDLVKNKRAIGRGIDLDDLKNLQIEE